MALARVQGTGRVSAAAVGSIALTFATPPAVGNGVIVAVINYTGGGTTRPSTACADNRGHTYLQAVQRLNSPVSAVLYVLAAVTTSAAPFTITVTYPGSGYYEAAAIEISGVGTGLVVDQTASRGDISTAAPSTDATPPLTADAVVLAACHGITVDQAAITVVTASPTWTQEFENLSYSTTIAGEGDTRILLSGALGTTQACSWTVTNPNSTAAVLAAFTASGPAAIATTQAYVWGPL